MKPSSTARRVIVQSLAEVGPSRVTCIDSVKPRARASSANSGLKHSSIRNFTRPAAGPRGGAGLGRGALFGTGRGDPRQGGHPLGPPAAGKGRDIDARKTDPALVER